jgi:hypothetical protein
MHGRMMGGPNGMPPRPLMGGPPPPMGYMMPHRPGPHMDGPQVKKQKTKSKGGSSCHQCKSRRNFIALTYCTSSLDKKSKRCRKKFCGHCLQKFYQENAAAITPAMEWICPSCRKICCCAACRRRQEGGGKVPMEECEASDEDDELEAYSIRQPNGPSPYMMPLNGGRMPSSGPMMGQYMMPPNQRGMINRINGLPTGPISVNGQPYIAAMPMGPPSRMPVGNTSKAKAKGKSTKAAKGKAVKGTAKGKKSKTPAKPKKPKKGGLGKPPEIIYNRINFSRPPNSHHASKNGSPTLSAVMSYPDSKGITIIELDENSMEQQYSLELSPQVYGRQDFYRGMKPTMGDSPRITFNRGPSGPMVFELPAQFHSSLIPADRVMVINSDQDGMLGKADEQGYLIIPTELLSSPGLKPLTPLVKSCGGQPSVARLEGLEGFVLEGYTVMDSDELDEHELDAAEHDEHDSSTSSSPISEQQPQQEHEQQQVEQQQEQQQQEQQQQQQPLLPGVSV